MRATFVVLLPLAIQVYAELQEQLITSRWPLVLQDGFEFPGPAITSFSQQLRISETTCGEVINDIANGLQPGQIAQRRQTSLQVVGALAGTCARFIPMRDRLHFTFSNAALAAGGSSQVFGSMAGDGVLVLGSSGAVTWKGQVMLDGPFITDVARQCGISQAVCGQIVRDIGGLQVVNGNILSSTQSIALRYQIQPTIIVRVASLCSPRLRSFNQFFSIFNSVAGLSTSIGGNQVITTNGQVINGGSQNTHQVVVQTQPRVIQPKIVQVVRPPAQVVQQQQIQIVQRPVYVVEQVVIQSQVIPRIQVFSNHINVPFRSGSSCISRILGSIHHFGFSRIAQVNNTDTQNQVMDIMGSITGNNLTLSAASKDELLKTIQRIAIDNDAPLSSIPHIAAIVTETMTAENSTDSDVHMAFKAIGALASENATISISDITASASVPAVAIDVAIPSTLSSFDVLGAGTLGGAIDGTRLILGGGSTLGGANFGMRAGVGLGLGAGVGNGLGVAAGLDGGVGLGVVLG
ncbi:hypothetical protein BC830DRAFT_1217153 [Chytriomyces sp. MP71]|nr:hypothetical protein BC830DRAFT_1217153 [Chytriomyces sp. MP71]